MDYSNATVRQLFVRHVLLHIGLDLDEENILVERPSAFQNGLYAALDFVVTHDPTESYWKNPVFLGHNSNAQYVQSLTRTYKSVESWLRQIQTLTCSV